MGHLHLTTTTLIFSILGCDSHSGLRALVQSVVVVNSNSKWCREGGRWNQVSWFRKFRKFLC